jgi:organic radical activating enzyme
MVKFNLFLTARCNWDCDYCFRQDSTVMDKIDPLTEERIFSFAPTIASLTNNVLFTGGEIGTIPHKTLDFLFKTFKGKTIRVATNGTWFKTPSFKKYKDQEGVFVLYHCVKNLTDEIEYENLSSSNIKYDFVITEDNWTEVASLLSRYPNILFYPIFDLRKSRHPSREFYRNVYFLLKPFDNVPEQVKQSAKVMGGDDIAWVDECIKAKPLRYRVDFNSSKITSCCLPEVGIDLTEKNLKEVANGKIMLPVDNRICSYCVIRWLNKSDDITTKITS